MNQPLLHVMIPAYGSSQYLEITLGSAIKNLKPQTLITIIEDPSESSEIEKLAHKYKSRVSYLKNETRLGISGNFNKCLKLSEATFTQICGHDDIILYDPTDQLTSMSVESESYCGTIFASEVLNSSEKNLEVIDRFKRGITPRYKLNSQINSLKFLENLMIGYWAYFPSIVWKTEIAKTFRFDSKYKSAMDLQFLIDLSLNGFEFTVSDQVILMYRRHIKSASTLNTYSGDRFIEEMRCHITVHDFAKTNKKLKLLFLSQIALSVRLNALYGLVNNQLNWFTKIRRAMSIIFLSLYNFK
jgi:hypothetical protein